MNLLISLQGGMIMGDLFSSYDIIAVMYELGVLRHLDYAFAKFIYSQEVSENKRVISLLAGLVSYATTKRNNVCIDLSSPLSFFDSVRFNLDSKLMQRFEDVCQDILIILTGVDYTEIFKDASTVGVCPVFGAMSQPLVFSAGRLYLLRYWEAEEVIASSIKERLVLREDLLDAEILPSLDSVYSRFSDYDKTWGQQVAVFMAMRSNLSLITGGPGTGKTTVVAVILALYFRQNPGAKVALVAPTGKAQARLKEAVMEELEHLSVSFAVKDCISNIEFKTVHSLLGLRRNSERRIDKLRYDLVVVDEASMVSVLIFRMLFERLATSTRLILLGDRDQLAAVEGGAVLSDLCASVSELSKFTQSFIDSFSSLMSPSLQLPQVTDSSSLLQDFITPLEFTFRFSSTSGIGQMKDLLLSESDHFNEFMHQDYKNYSDSLSMTEFKSFVPSKNQAQLWSYIESWSCRTEVGEVNFLSYLNSSTISEAYRKFSDFQIITALNKGVLGVEGINNFIINKLSMRVDGSKGLPVMIEKNDYQTGLFNGDIGMFWPDSNGDMKVWFTSSEKDNISDIDGFKAFSPAKLPQYSPAFAMTIHKSQGSGFGAVMLVLPSVESEILTKELLYTAITRAKQKIAIFGSVKSILTTSKIRVCRISGLVDKFR